MKYTQYRFLFVGLIMLYSGMSLLQAQTTYSFEYLIGKTSAANSWFPDLDANQTASFSIGKKITDPQLNWAHYLNHPTVGINLEYANFGNKDVLGSGYSLHPYLEVPILESTIKNLSWHTGIGISYFTQKYHPAENWQNKAVSTDYSWSFRTFLYYRLWHHSAFDTRLSLGYTHKSNGHTRWPNNGLNSFLAGINLQFGKSSEPKSTAEKSILKSQYRYFSFETGIGSQSLSRLYVDALPVYSTGISYGTIYDNTFKLGLGLYYRFYQSYYDYIKAEREFINDSYPWLKKNVFYNSSTYGINTSAEILMNHVSIVAELGLNIDKPFYKIDYRINNEGYANGEYFPGEIDTKYWIKRFVSGKMGLKYYLWNTKNAPKYNLSIGALICSNLGQADYSELNIGFIHILK
ncbi:acyloxyacyl hydrolase [Flavobacterium sp.]|uniref:acyloxyacyl hydrolase n=1 Tax=Flavobacterium sp. TaxID=239 RepID=UPI002FDEEE3A